MEFLSDSEINLSEEESLSPSIDTKSKEPSIKELKISSDCPDEFNLVHKFCEISLNPSSSMASTVGMFISITKEPVDSVSKHL